MDHRLFSFISSNWRGAFYGAAGRVLFRLWPPQTPDMIAVTTSGKIAQVSFAGTGGYLYQLMRSADLKHWTVFDPVIMTVSGVFTNVDPSPPNPADFYRGVWIP